MFDISFGELMLIGVIALVVIGPQRLPAVARTLGHLIGRAQRYVNDVKRDIQKEINLEELNKVKNQMESAARSVQSSMREASNSLAQPIEEAQQALQGAATAVQGSLRLDPLDTDAKEDPAAASTPPPAPSDAEPQNAPKTQTNTEAGRATHAHADTSAQSDHIQSDHIQRPST